MQRLLDAVGEPPWTVGARLGLSGSSWAEVLRNGCSDAQADRFAVRLGYHPYEIWPELVEAWAEDRLCERDGCQQVVEGARRFCSGACQRAAWQARHKERVR